MALSNLRTIITDPSLVLPLDDDHVYKVPPCSAGLWLRLQEHQAGIEARIKAANTVAELVDDEESMTGMDLYRLSLGPVYDQMLGDGVSLVELTVAGMTAYLWQLGGERNVAAAEAIWQSGGKALAPAVAALTSKTPSGRTGDAVPGPKQARSGSGTRTRTPRKTAKKAAATRSRKSSPTAN